jgi:hypothetical protein
MKADTLHGTIDHSIKSGIKYSAYYNCYLTVMCDISVLLITSGGASMEVIYVNALCSTFPLNA